MLMLLDCPRHASGIRTRVLLLSAPLLLVRSYQTTLAMFAPLLSSRPDRRLHPGVALHWAAPACTARRAVGTVLARPAATLMLVPS